MYKRNSLLDKLPQILFTILGLLIVYMILEASSNIGQALINALGF